jgi:outer membrane immunogenic protein
MNYSVFILPFSLLVLSVTSFADSATPKSTYDWTGVYVGGFMGGATGSDVSNTATTATLDSESSLWNDPGDANNNYSTKAGFIGGGTVGYNWQIGKTPYLVGLEGEYGYLSQKNSKTDPNAATWNAANPDSIPDNSQSSTSIGADYGYGLVGGRLGYALDRSLIYIKSGAVFTTVNSSWSDTAYGLNGTSNKATTTGYALGAGFEYALPFKYFTNVSVKTEYLYFGIPTSRTINTYSTINDDVITTQTISGIQTTSGIHTAKIGVNYKF